MWLARDENGELALHTDKPFRDESAEQWSSGYWLNKGESYDEFYGNNWLLLPENLFPDVTWENSPFEIKLETQ